MKFFKLYLDLVYPTYPTSLVEPDKKLAGFGPRVQVALGFGLIYYKHFFSPGPLRYASYPFQLY